MLWISYLLDHWASFICIFIYIIYIYFWKGSTLQNQIIHHCVRPGNPFYPCCGSIEVKGTSLTKSWSQDLFCTCWWCYTCCFAPCTLYHTVHKTFSFCLRIVYEQPKLGQGDMVWCLTCTAFILTIRRQIIAYHYRRWSFFMYD